jgi:hypothetical protein
MRGKRMADAFMLVSPAEVNNQLEDGTTRSVDREKEKAKNLLGRKTIDRRRLEV